MVPRTASQKDSRALIKRIILLGVLAALFLSILILSWVPPVSRDALTHHLYVPRLYLQHGGIYEIPSLVFSYYPMNLDLLYLIPLYLGNDIAPKFIHFSFALLTAWLVFDYIKRRIDAVYGLLAALMFLSIPSIVKLSTTVYVDLGVIFFSFASILYVFRWRENGFRTCHLMAAGLFCGLAMGTKYNGLVIFFLLTLFVPFFYSRVVAYQRQGPVTGADRANSPSFLPAAKHAVLFMAAALIVFSPWMIRNAYWTGNPIYPLYNSFFNAPDHGKAEKSQRSMGHLVARKFVYKETPVETLSIPIRIFFQGRDDDPKYFDGRLNPYLFFLPFLAFLGMSKNNALIKGEKKFLLAFATLYLMFTYVTIDMRIRYIAPIIPPLIILSVYGLHEIVQRIGGSHSKIFRRVMCGGVLLAMVGLLMLNARYVVAQFQIVKPLAYIRGEVSRDDYIEQYRPEYPAIRTINQNLQENARILAIFVGNRGYYFNKPVLFFPGSFKKGIKDAAGIEQTIENTASNGVTHLLVRQDLFSHWLEGLTNGQRERITRIFRKKVRLLFTEKGYGLYKIV